MNRTYRTLWNASTGAWVAVSELSRACGKRSGGSMALAGSGMLALGLLLAPGLGLAQNYGATGGVGGGGTANGGAAGAAGALPGASPSPGNGGTAGIDGAPDGGDGGPGLGGSGGGGGYSNVATGDVSGALVKGGNGGRGSLGGGGGGGDGVRITPAVPAVPVLITATVTGGSGGSGSGSGGGGGAGVVFLGDSALTTNAQITGGNGGSGAVGGGGGAGVVLQGAGQLTANAAITGGNGGTGHNIGGIDLNGNAGVGVLLVGAGKITTGPLGSITGGLATSIGSGGAGVSVLAGGTIDNAGTIRGGNGGGVSSAGSAFYNPGGVGSGGALGYVHNTDSGGAPGGAGITGRDLTITNSGTIAGGIGLVSGAQANAITFTAGTNSLTLQTGSVMTGALEIRSGATASIVAGNTGLTVSNAILLGGNATVDTNGNDMTFSGVISGVGDLSKTGNGTMTLTGSSNSYTTTVNGGTLAIENNGKVSSSRGNIGVAAGSLGAVTVSGASSNWTNNGDLVVGGQGTGTLTVQGGGTLSNDYGIIGTAAGSIGTATVSGLGSTWSNSGALMVGGSGTGTLTIEKGGKVSSIVGLIGQSAGGIGHVTVTGVGSSWTNINNITLDRGSLTVSDGGSLVVASGTGLLSVATNAGYTGVLNIGGAVGSAAQAAGTVAAGEVHFGAGNGSLNFNHTDPAYTFGTKITGDGALNQVAGTTLLTAANTYTGATTINGGTLRVNGSIANSNTTVNNGSTLGGSGTVGNTTIAAGGVLAPGNSIGILNVAGNLRLAPGAIYRVEVDAAGNNDRTNVTGTATLNGTVAVQAAAGSYAANTTYTILNATGGRTGNFAGVTSDLAFLDPTLSYDAKNVFLNLARNSTSFNAGTIAITPNQMATATALQNATAGASGDMSTVLGTLTGLSATQARAAYDSASGVGLVALRRASASFAATLNNQMLDRLNTTQGPAATLAHSFANRPILLAANSHGSELSGLLNTTMSDTPPQQFSLAGGAPLPSASSAQGRGFWLRGSGGYQDIKSDGNAAASQQRNTTLSAGFDTQLQDGLVVGVALNSSNARLSFDNSDTGKSRGTALAVYGSYDTGPWAFRASASAGWNDNHLDRAVTVGALSRLATANFNSNTLSAYGEAVYSLPMNGWTLKPLAALSLSRDKADGFTETGAGALNLQVAGQTITSTKSLLGAKASFEAGSVRLEPRALWAHEFGDLNTPMTAQFQGAASASPFQVSGVALKRDTLILGLGATGSVSKNFDLFADVQLEHNARQRNAGLMVGLRARW